MESTAAFRSFHYSVGTVSHVRSLLEKPGMVPMQNASWPTSNRSCIQGLTAWGKHSATKQKGMLVSCVKTSEVTEIANFNGSSDGISQGSMKKNTVPAAIFPNGFEALVLEVCDETEVAELKLKVGDFEMHLKRDIGASKTPVSFVSPTTAPPIPTKPMIESIPDAPPPEARKSSPKKASPFTSSLEKSPKLAALEASGSNAYVLVTSPTVGSFRRGRTVKGKKQPPICKEGDVIKEGQVIGFVDQFGTELPVKSDVAGEVLKLLFVDGEAVGFGDPLIAVLPSFHGIK